MKRIILEELVSSWRKQADILDERSKEANVAGDANSVSSTRERQIMKVETLRHCANDLEKLLLVFSDD